MKIVFCCTNTKAEPWLEGFRKALPGVDIWEWQAGQTASADKAGQAPKMADHAVVWSPRKRSLMSKHSCKTCSTWALGLMRS